MHDDPGESTIRLGFTFEQPAPGDVGRKRRRIRENNERETKRLRYFPSRVPRRYGNGDRNVIIRVRPVESGSRRDADYPESIESFPRREHVFTRVYVLRVPLFIRADTHLERPFRRLPADVQ